MVLLLFGRPPFLSADKKECIKRKRENPGTKSAVFVGFESVSLESSGTSLPRTVGYLQYSREEMISQSDAHVHLSELNWTRTNLNPSTKCPDLQMHYPPFSTLPFPPLEVDPEVHSFFIRTL